MKRKGWLRVEIVEYDPNNPDTYPSVCSFPEDVYSRFGFTGGERLVFTVRGSYIGHLVKTVESGNDVVGRR